MKLRSKFILYTALISVVFASAIVFDRLVATRYAILQRAADRAEYMNSFLSEVISRHVAAGTTDRMKELLKSFEHFEHIAYMRVTDTSGKVLFTQAEPGVNLDSIRPNRNIFRTSVGIFDTATDITAEGKKVGRLELGLSIKGVREAAENVMWRGITISMFFIILITLVVWGLTQRLGRELSVLDGLAENLDNGKPVSMDGFSSGSDTGKIVDTMIRLNKRLKEEQEKRAAIEAQKDEFYAMTVHDLKQPVTALKASLDLLLSEEESRNFGEKQLRTLAQIARSSLGMLTAMITDILSTAKLDTPGYIVEKERIPLADFLKSCAEENAPVVRAAKKTWSFSLPGDAEGLWIFADRDLIKRVIGNLIMNAVQYTPAGGMIKLGMRLKGKDKVAIYVSDEGEGIPEDFREEIFKKYSTMSKSSKNLGLGLAFCKLAAEKHSALLEVQSAVGKGTEISFVLPISREKL